jgi:hypothetical protein
MARLTRRTPNVYRPAATGTATDVFDDSHEFFDDVHGRIVLSQLERDCVDTPEFQRLFRIGQLGFIDLVYHTASHTRGMHSIGTCGMAKHLLDVLKQNAPKFHALRKRMGVSEPEPPRISRSECALIRLGALLHDLPHGPFSHDIEKKTHVILLPESLGGGKVRVKSHYGPYEKHDDFARNPALYTLLFDTEASILARVLRFHSPSFWDLIRSEMGTFPLLRRFVDKAHEMDWSTASDDSLATLLFHLLVFEDPELSGRQHAIDIRKSFDTEATSPWGLGPEKGWSELHRIWYQPFRHDIIGNTLSADLLDYLQRDLKHLAIPKGLDLKLLDYYTLAPMNFGQQTTPETESAERSLFTSRPLAAGQAPVLFRCAIDLNDYKRGTVRSERVNDVFRLLDLRHEIHEKAVFHRVVQSAMAMLCRAVLVTEPRPTPKELYGLDTASPVMSGDDQFLGKLMAAKVATRKYACNHSLPQKLIERRVYRPLMIAPGNRIDILLEGVCSPGDMKEREGMLRALAAIIDSRYFSPLLMLASWCIEKLLEHALADEEDVDRFIGQVSTSPALLEWAIKDIRPKRVIIWTTPYKQLYKDPALLVRVAEKVATIEELRTIKAGNGRAHDVSALRTRAMAAMQDAETKYEGLWKFYVFLSDGLFYTGALARLLPDHPCATDLEAHRAHLEAAQNLAIRAIRAAWDVWESGLKRGEMVRLDEQIAARELATLLRVFSGDGYRFRTLYAHIVSRVSAVEVDQYLHGKPPTKCRDVRYKYDLPGSWPDVLDDLGVEPEDRKTLEELLRTLSVDLNTLAREEIVEIAERLCAVREPLVEFVHAEAARGESPFPPSLLKRAWRNEPGWEQRT